MTIGGPIHFIPGGSVMLRHLAAAIRSIPCGAGKKRRGDLEASTNPEDVTCARCRASFSGPKETER